MHSTKSISEGKSKKQKDASGCMLVFGLLFFVVGSFFFWFMTARPLWRTYSAQSWPTSQATILDSKVVESDSDDGTSYAVAIQFSYVVDKQQMVSNNWSFLNSSVGRDLARNTVKRFPIGSKHDCYYNPRTANDAVLDRSLRRHYFFGFFILIFVVVGGALARAGWHKRVEYKKRQRQLTLKPAEQNDKMVANVAPLPPLLLANTPWFEFEGPQRLKPTKPRWQQFWVMLGFATFWNLVCWLIFANVFQQNGLFNFLTIFVLVFVIAGLALISSVFYSLLALFNPVVTIALSEGTVPVGAVVDVAWETSGRASRFRELNLELVGTEHATYTRGTSTYNEQNVFLTIPILQTSETSVMQFGSATVGIPLQTVPSFVADHNRIEWTIDVHGKVRGMPAVKESMRFFVKPNAATGPNE